ncbi:MAG TPA: thioredoxin family protein [Candidatus Nanoarchaeia archaeon]|nr:thioredoxin family protein [Candidatus Nanoarchaeia archaeon]
MQELTEQTFRPSLKNGSSIVEFYTDWCTVCKQMAPTLDNLSKAYPNVRFAKLNAGSNPIVASMFTVMSVPTFLFVKDGRIVDQVSGFMTQGQFKEKIEKKLR